MNQTYIGKGVLHIPEDMLEESAQPPVLNIFVDEDDERPGLWYYNAYDNLQGVAVHNGFATQREAVDHAVKTYKAKRQVTVMVTVELENPHMVVTELVDMIAGRAATIQGVNAMKADGVMHEDWFEAPHVKLES